MALQGNEHISALVTLKISHRKGGQRFQCQVEIKISSSFTGEELARSHDLVNLREKKPEILGPPRIIFLCSILQDLTRVEVV